MRNKAFISTHKTLSIALIFLSGCTSMAGISSPTKNFANTKQLAESGNPEAQFDLGNNYKNGYGTEVNKELACQWFEKSASQGFNKAKFALYYCYKYSNPAEARKILIFFASNGNGYAQSEIQQGLRRSYGTFSLEQVQLLARNNIANENDYYNALNQMRSDPVFKKNFEANQSNDLLYYLTQKDEANKNHISLEQQLKNIKALQLAKEAEAKRQSDFAKEQELKARAAQEKAAADAAAKAAAAKAVMGL